MQHVVKRQGSSGNTPRFPPQSSIHVPHGPSQLPAGPSQLPAGLCTHILATFGIAVLSPPAISSWGRNFHTQPGSSCITCGQGSKGTVSGAAIRFGHRRADLVQHGARLHNSSSQNVEQCRSHPKRTLDTPAITGGVGTCSSPDGGHLENTDHAIGITDVLGAVERNVRRKSVPPETPHVRFPCEDIMPVCLPV